MSANPQIGPSRQVILYDRQAASEPLMLAPPDEGQAGSQDLAVYWYVLSKRRWTILAVAFALTAIVIVFSFLMTPVYRATARLEVEPETPLLQSVSDTYQHVEADDAFIQTQIQVLKGESVAWQTIEQLGLAPTLGVIPREKLTTAAVERHKIDLIKAFQKHLVVELLPKTRLLSVGFESSDPQQSALVVTTLVNAYLDSNYRQKYEAIERSGWMEQQLRDLKEKVEKSQQAVVSSEQEHQSASTGDKQDVVGQMLVDMGHTLTSAKSDRIQKESLFNQVVINRSQMAALVNDELLGKLEGRSAELKEQYAATVAQYGPKFPKATRLELQIAEEQSEIEREQNRVIDRIRNDYEAAHNREQLAAAAVASQKEDLGKLNQLLVQDNILRHEFETNQQLYQSLLQRLKDATVSAGLRSTSIHLVDPALPPTKPVRPLKLLYAAVASLAGIVLGVMGAFGQDRLDSSIRTAEEAEALIVTPALGAIPFERSSAVRHHALSKNGRGHQLALTLTKHRNSSLAEAFRALGTAVSGPCDPPKTLLITSAQNGEGKTVTTLNLGQALAQRKGPVLIMDCDLRRNGIAQALGLKNDKGVSTVLSGEHDISEAIQQYIPQPNLWVLTSGPVPPYPAELLASEKMAALLENMAARFACVIIDSPPVLAVTDATILSTRVDRVLLVAASGTTPRAGLVRTRRILANAGARILGVAVNKLDPRFQSYQDYAYSYSVDK
jgi:capsular exopolysaccharide synthesis family protein